MKQCRKDSYSTNSQLPYVPMKSKASIPFQVIRNVILSNINYLFKNSNFVSERTNIWNSPISCILSSD